MYCSIQYNIHFSLYRFYFVLSCKRLLEPLASFLSNTCLVTVMVVFWYLLMAATVSCSLPKTLIVPLSRMYMEDSSKWGRLQGSWQPV